MIISLIMDILYASVALLTAPINIPSLPDGVQDVVNQYLGYISDGMTILNVYCDLGYLFTLFSLILLVDIGLMLYKFVMWILRKIPMLGID